jgi:hypothetical protein
MLGFLGRADQARLPMLRYTPKSKLKVEPLKKRSSIFILYKNCSKYCD